MPEVVSLIAERIQDYLANDYIPSPSPSHPPPGLSPAFPHSKSLLLASPSAPRFNRPHPPRRPSTLLSSSTSSSSAPISLKRQPSFSHLYLDAALREAKQQIRTRQRQVHLAQQEMQGVTFTPDINPKSRQLAACEGS
jgi:hypothetical protein